MSNIVATIKDYIKNTWHNTDQDYVMAEHINGWETALDNHTQFLKRFAWQPNHSYPKNSVILYPFGLHTKLVSQNAGISGANEPTWADAQGQEGQRVIQDNTIVWKEFPMQISSDITPIGTIKQQLWHTAPPGYLKLDTSVVLKRTDYPELWEFVQKYAPLISEVDWQKQAAKQTSVGYYSTGDGTTTFRTPVILDFARGGSISNIGKYYNDQNITIPNNVNSFSFGNYSTINPSGTADSDGIITVSSNYNDSLTCSVNGLIVTQTSCRSKYGQGYVSNTFAVKKGDNYSISGARFVRFMKASNKDAVNRDVTIKNSAIAIPYFLRTLNI